MAKRTIVQGSTNQTIDIFIPDSSSSTGAGLTGLVFNSSGLTCFFREGATVAAVELTLVTLALITTAHDDGGFKEIDATNMPGMYRLDLSDTIVSGTNPYVTIHLKGATNMAPITAELELTLFNPFDGVRAGLTALPNAAADAAGGLPISDAGGLDLDTILDVAVSTRLAPTVAARTLDITATGAAGIDWANVENQGTTVDLSATDINLVDTITTYTGNTPQTGDNFARIGVNGAGLSNINLPDQTMDITGDITGNLSGSVGSVISGVTVTTNNDKAGYSISGTITTLDGLENLSAAQVNGEVLDVLTVDTFAEPGSVPAATSSILDKLNWLFATGRNKVTQTATTQLVRNDGDSGTIGTSTVSDDGTTFIRGEYS